jgi:hypothetical protein
VLVGLVVLGGLLLAVDRWQGPAQRPRAPGSSYATTSSGLAAYAQLLEARGHPVERLRDDLGELDLGGGGGEVLIVSGGGGFADADRAAVDRFVGSGGRLVLIGSSAVDELAGPELERLDWTADGLRTAAPEGTAPETARVRSVEGSGIGAWQAAGPPGVLGTPSRSLVAAVGRGRGRILAVADEGILENRLLAHADNAALGVDLAGGAGATTVRFAETIHGYRHGSGLLGLPVAWRWSLFGLLVTSLVAMWSVGTRLGPPQLAERELPPPRVAGVEAIAATLTRTRDRSIVAVRLREAVHRRLARRGDAPAQPTPARLAELGASVGMTDDQVATVVGEGGAARDALALGGALARLEGDRR